jgi:predicted transposase YdaD
LIDPNRLAPWVYQTRFDWPGTRYEFEVIRLWEQPVAPFLASPGLLPFAVLAQTRDRPEVLQAVVQQIEAMGDRSSRRRRTV